MHELLNKWCHSEIVIRQTEHLHSIQTQATPSFTEEGMRSFSPFFLFSFSVISYCVLGEPQWSSNSRILHVVLSGLELFLSVEVFVFISMTIYFISKISNRFLILLP